MMKIKLLSLTLVGAFLITSCSDSDLRGPSTEVSDLETSQLISAGFDVENIAPSRLEDGRIIVEGDIIIDNLSELRTPSRLAVEEQYSTNNLVNAGGGRVITLYAPTGRKGYSAGMLAGLDEAISRYNAENLTISFARTSSSNGADIVMKRLSKRDERRGVLGSAGFPTSSGDPYGQILMSGILESTYGLSTGGIATIIGHEMGHCIGFRHTDFFDRSISCGGSPSDEGTAGIGANHIQGTPTGADLSGNGSYMLACTDGSSRPFTNADQTALDYLY
jgi:hypothetical protein